MEAKLKHLDYIQAAIARMSNSSFLFKGWSITIAGALLGFAVVEDKSGLVAIALVTTLLFWGLDGYYLWLERGFVALHKHVAALPEDKIDFSMQIGKSHAARRWFGTCWRPHLWIFYGSMAGVELISIFIVRSK